MAKRKGKRKSRVMRRLAVSRPVIAVRRRARRIKAATAVVVQRVAASRPVTVVRRAVSYGKRSRMQTSLSGMDWRTLARDYGISSAGGVASSLVSTAIKVASKKPKKADDASPALHMALQGLIGVGVMWVFGGKRDVRSFVSGMNGSAAAEAANKYLLDKATKALEVLVD